MQACRSFSVSELRAYSVHLRLRVCERQQPECQGGILHDPFSTWPVARVNSGVYACAQRTFISPGP